MVTRSRRRALLFLLGLSLLGAAWAAEGLPRPSGSADLPAPAPPARISPAPRVSGGSYTPRHIAAAVHISPEEAIQAELDLRAAWMIGVHWGTFGLAREAYDEPPKRIAAEVARRALDPQTVRIPKPGESMPW